MHLVRRTTAGWLVATVLALVAGTVGVARPAGAADGSCDGVWVVVDARALGGELTTRCAEGDPSSGLEALRMTGHSYAFVPRQPGMVCTIDARPDPCNGAPTDAYWGYFHAEAGGDWVYATYGAGNRDPEPGTVEGWAFGADARPGRRPPSNASASAPASSPSPTSEPAPAATPSARPTPEPADEGTSAPAAAPETTPTDEPTPAPSAEPAPSASSGGATPGEAAADTEVPAAADPGAAPEESETMAPVPEQSGGLTDAHDGAAPVGPIVGGVLFAGIAGAGVLRSRRRDDGQG